MSAKLTLSRRRLIAAAAGSVLLQACGTSSTLSPQAVEMNPISLSPTAAGGSNSVRLFACSGYTPDPARNDIALERLAQAGFAVDNVQAAYRRFQRFAGTAHERAQDLQALADGSAPMPKMLLAVRGGYGANHILPLVDWAGLAQRMREHGTVLMGFSDVCAVQAALLVHGAPSFAGPMLYSEFGKPQPSAATMRYFIDAFTQSPLTFQAASYSAFAPDTRIEGIFWGGNLSVLTSLIGTPYFPDIDGGILFLEDVGEQPYRIDRMLQQLEQSGCLKKQRALVLGNFRMSRTADIYDQNYDFDTILRALRSQLRIPVLENFPFGHIRDKATFPLGVPCVLDIRDGHYSVTFHDYPRLDTAALNLDTLLPFEIPFFGDFLSDEE